MLRIRIRIIFGNRSTKDLKFKRYGSEILQNRNDFKNILPPRWIFASSASTFHLCFSHPQGPFLSCNRNLCFRITFQIAREILFLFSILYKESSLSFSCTHNAPPPPSKIKMVFHTVLHSYTTRKIQLGD
jgi:hypothetical protein